MFILPDLRRHKEDLIKELRKEYNRLGKPLLGADFIEPEVVTNVSKAWWSLHATRQADGKVVFPLRVQHPGKQWLAQAARHFSCGPQTVGDASHFVFDPQQKSLPASGSKHGPTPSTSEAPPSRSDDEHEYKIIFREGCQRLLKISWLGARVADVPLPKSTQWKLIVEDGCFYLSGRAGSELVECDEYVETLMPSGGLTRPN